MPDALNFSVVASYDGRGINALAADITRAGQAAGTAGADIGQKVGAGAAEAEAGLRRLTKSADDLLATLKLGVGIDLGGRIVGAIAALPAAFQAATARGVEFNATVESAQLGVAAILRQFQPGQFSSVGSAMGKSGEVIEQLKVKATETTATFQDLVKAFSANAGAATAAGVPIGKQADLLVTLSNAVAGLGIETSQLTQETRALLTGEIDQNAAVARTLGITREQIEAARAQGKVYEFLTGKLAAFGEAGALASKTYAGALSNLGDTIDQVLGDATEPVFAELRKDYLAFADELKKPEVVQALREAGIEIAHLVETGAGLLSFAVANAGALSTLAHGTGAFGAAVAAVKIKDLILGLALKVTGLGASTAATVAETGALAADTAATVANTEAKLANAAAGRAQGGAGTGAATVAGISGALSVGLVAGTALALVIERAGAGIEAAAKHANELGDAFVKANGSNGRFVTDARDFNAYLERRATLEKEIATLRKEVEAGTNYEESVATGLNAQGEQAAQLLTLAERRLATLNEISRGERDVSNIQKDQTAELQRRAPLQGEALKQANELAATLNDRRLAAEALATQEKIIADTAGQQLTGARARLELLGVDPKRLASLTTANQLLGLSDTLIGNARTKALEEAAALASVEDRLKGIRDRLKEQQGAAEGAIKATLDGERKQLADLQVRRPGIDRSTPAGNAEYIASLQTEAVLTRGIQANAEGLKKARIEAIPGLADEVGLLKEAAAAVPRDGSDASSDKLADLLRRQRAAEAVPDAIDAIPIFRDLYRDKLNPGGPAAPPEPVAPVAPAPASSLPLGQGADSGAIQNFGQPAADAANALGDALKTGFAPVTDALNTTAGNVAGQVEPVVTAVNTLGAAYGEGFQGLTDALGTQGEQLGSLAVIIADIRRENAMRDRRIELIANA